MTLTWLSFTSLILASFLFSTAPASPLKKQCVMITKAKIEGKIGPRVKCFNERKEILHFGNKEEMVCFGNSLEPTRVQFDSSGVATHIWLRTSCIGVHGLKRRLNQIVPEKARGKFRHRTETTAQVSCEAVFEEEYDCVSIKYSEERCRGCAPASITVTWK